MAPNGGFRGGNAIGLIAGIMLMLFLNTGKAVGRAGSEGRGPPSRTRRVIVKGLVCGLESGLLLMAAGFTQRCVIVREAGRTLNPALQLINFLPAADNAVVSQLGLRHRNPGGARNSR